MTIITTSVNTQPSAPIAFDWQGTPLRSFKDSQGDIWFIAKDVCKALSLTNTARGLDRLDPDQKGVTTVNTLGGQQTVTTISEPGLYALILRSRKAEAKAFQRWVLKDVLPAIRAHGVYVRGEELLVSSATLEELQAQVAKLQAIATQGIQAKSTIGIDALEEREARHNAFKMLKGGRTYRPNNYGRKPQ